MRRALILVLRVGLGAVFLYAAYTKLRQPWMLFAMSINSYQILPEWAVTFLGRTLPWFELLLGALLIVGRPLRTTAASASALLALFFAVMLRSYHKGMSIDCGCFGFGEALGPKTLIRDGLLVVLALILTLLAFRQSRLSPPGGAAAS